MSRFYASAGGAAGAATRQGTANSGCQTNCVGWGLGVEVVARANASADVFEVTINGGSSGQSTLARLATVRELAVDGVQMIEVALDLPGFPRSILLHRFSGEVVS